MGHSKVVRRSMRPNEWIELRLGWLKNHIIKQKIEITAIKGKEARQVDECQYEFYDETWKDIRRGDTIFTPDGTLFLEMECEIPRGWENQEVWFSITTASEMMVKINGKWAGGLDPNRDRIDITAFIQNMRTLKIEIEAYNRSKPDDERADETRHLKGCRQIFSGAWLVTLNASVLSAYYDVSILNDLISSEEFNEDYREMVQNHLDKALTVIDFEEADMAIYSEQVRSMAQYIQTNIFENQTYQGNGQVALVAHSHLDIAYYWRRVHAVQKNARTCLIQLRLMDKYPAFTYAHTQPFAYELLEKYYPELFDELKERVREGRFEPVGAMYVEPDCNVPTAESLIRQCLYGQKFYEEKFGMLVDTCWIPDVFGNSWILPQILTKSGVKYFVSNKMSTWNDTNRFPHNNFIWKGLDGSQVYACVPPTHFITWNMPSQVVENWEAFQDKEASAETLSMFGYGDGGSGVTEQMLEYMNRFDKISVMPKTRHVTGKQFLDDNFHGNEKLEVWDGELYLEMHRGTFTTKADIKKMNRILEIQLRNVEILSVLAHLQGRAYPKTEITELYKTVLVNQFHDILPGSHILPVAKDAMDDYRQVNERLEQMLAEAVAFLKTGTDRGVSLFNTLGFRRQGIEFVAGSFSKIGNEYSQKDCFLGKEGMRLHVNRIEGMSSVRLDLGKQKEQENWFQWNEKELVTPFYHVVFDSDGSLLRLYDKQNDKEWVKGPNVLNKLRLFKDYPGTYDAWDILPGYRDCQEQFDVVQSIRPVSEGNVFVAFQVVLKTEKSQWQQTIRFFKDSPEIEFEHDVDWNETNRLAKAEFEINILTRYARCDSSAGTVIRETHKNTSWQKSRFEVCQHKWSDLSDGGVGMVLINESKYGISLDGSRMGLSLLRAPVRPDPTSDRGNHKFAYLLVPHAGTPESAGIVEKAWAYNVPLLLVDGEISRNQGFTIKEKNIHLQSLKMAENEKDLLVVRLVELYAMSGRGTIELPLVPKRVGYLDLLEREIDGDLNVTRNEVTFQYSSNEIVTIGIWL